MFLDIVGSIGSEHCCRYFAKPKPGGKKGGSLITFDIVHYAGQVTYDATAWLDKNNDTLHPDFATLLTGSQVAILSCSCICIFA